MLESWRLLIALNCIFYLCLASLCVTINQLASCRNGFNVDFSYYKTIKTISNINKGYSWKKNNKMNLKCKFSLVIYRLNTSLIK